MRKRKVKIRPRFFIIIFISAVIISGGIFGYHSLLLNLMNHPVSKPEELFPDEKYLSIFSNKIYLVYGDKLVIESDVDINVKKGKTAGDLIKEENFAELMAALNSVLPERVDRYVLGNEVTFAGDVIPMPYIEAEGGKYISNVEINEIFNDNYYRRSEAKKNKIIVDIMNGTGDTVYASRVGGFLSKKYGYIINNSEYESGTGYTYITGIDIEEEELKNIAKRLKEKYIKTGNTPQMNTMANAVVVLGNDKVTDFSIKIYSVNGANVHLSKLKTKGYTKIEKIKTQEMPSEDKIVYNGEDVFTAVKIGEILGITALEEDNSKKNIIEVYITGGE